jgi:hypothetical protein
MSLNRKEGGNQLKITVISQEENLVTQVPTTALYYKDLAHNSQFYFWKTL